ncbi:FAD dependent oxidoreductase [Apiospora aurea]|uniref:FAD dependent oxidoreductase n=1 Tax=Apiospora aurea TaxID=335848 RepID=A0ABR1PXR4_9PEZI
MLKYLSLAVLSTLITLGTATRSIPRCGATDPADYDSRDVYHRDVVIIGGGSSGVYSAMRLRDHGKTVMIIEKQDKLGGHAEAWTDPPSGTPVNIGGVVFATPPRTFVDCTTGTVVDFTEPDAAAFAVALDKYSSHLSEFPALQDSFNMTYPVHPDLLLSFGEFVAKYGLGDLVPQVFRYNQGAAPLLDISMVYLFKYLNSGEISSLKQGFLSVNCHSVTELYRRAADGLAHDVLFDSTVVGMDRSLPEEVRVAVQTPAGLKLVIAKKLLSTIPPVLANLVGYDISAEERTLFSQFFANGYYTGVLNNTGLDPGAALVNHAPGRPHGIPDLPGIYAMHSTPLPGDRFLTNVFYGSPAVLPDDEVKADIVKAIHRYQMENGLPVTRPDWLTFSSHSPLISWWPMERSPTASTTDSSGCRGGVILFIMGRRGIRMSLVRCGGLLITT